MPVFPEAVREQLSSAALKSIGWSLNTVARISPPMAGELALKLFSRPRSSKSSTHHPEILDTAELIYYPTPDGQDQVSLFHWPGDGPTVFLAHGWESNTSRWQLLIRGLRDTGFRIIGVDAPAHGYSGGAVFNVPLYAGVFQEAFQRFPPDIFIGHSAGAMAGIYHLAKKDPGAFRSMVVMAVPYELEDLMNTFRKIVGMNELVFTGLKDAFNQHFGFPMSDFSIPKFARELQLPGLIVHDRDDTIAPYAGSLEIHRNWSGSSLFSTSGLGHSLPGDGVVREVMQYLEQYRH
ncbi:alpha/beta fold hydrolase [Flavilitoribacter nigricans]|uniref:Alpha/beta hydrolase n=1 Tax=Flavilitoribacter nigricans (strain ATCC 23147 / DSM 23189 / NBRC 102662 / NCIMB 1420 / SS-2) TaxID=1122177 RepID=A0A2D0N9Y3_FLAN2|nr:alpha/beta hydrolase [Flavilitoribacter nigricans]PHN05331.1 alpha/beta hydrolase [Flavilitoribacter nigricans DSM 23189 = NBRC 102662]